jgi:hypothetical protein
MSPEAKDRSVPFDPGAGSGPDGVLLPPRDGGEVVALLVDASVRGDLWGERAAVALAREWAARGRKVVLVDGDVETPSLHELLRVPNLEGLADAILYGASLERVETPPRASPSGSSRRARWWRTRRPSGEAIGGMTFLDQLRSRDEVALLFLPTGGSGSSLLAGQGDRILRMARPGTTSSRGPSLRHSSSTPRGRRPIPRPACQATTPPGRASSDRPSRRLL